MNTTIKILVLAVALTAVILGVKYTRVSLFNPFQYIKYKGAKKTSIATAGDRYDYGNYGFYPNNRVVRFNPIEKGTYNKEVIIWDDGTTTKLEDIFK